MIRKGLRSEELEQRIDRRKRSGDLGNSQQRTAVPKAEWKKIFKQGANGDFPGGPVVKIPGFQCRAHRFYPWLGNYDPACCVTKKIKRKMEHILAAEGWRRGQRQFLLMAIGAGQREGHQNEVWKVLDSDTVRGLLQPGAFGGFEGWVHLLKGLPWWLSSKEPTCNARVTGDVRSTAGLGTSPGGGHGNPLRDPCLENPMDREEPGGLQSVVWQRGVTETI